MIDDSLDTNVLVYAYDNRDTAKRARAWRILESTPERTISTQVLIELFNALTRKLATPLSREQAAEITRGYAELTVIKADAQFVDQAIELGVERQVSVFDALIVRAAQVGGCDRLLTEDLQDGARFGSVTVENPFRDL